MLKVTVLMPIYNGEKYLKEAIDSILNQTFSNFEFLIIDDGSNDETISIIKSYSDSRIRLVQNEKKLKLAATLNKGLDLALGEYIARMDCDDISLPERLDEQVAFMDNHPDVGICGTWFEFTDFGQIIKWPEQHDEIKAQLFYNTALGHPTVMMRTDIMRQYGLYYDVSYGYSEDYELWTRLSRVTKLANIPKVLLKYRIHHGQASYIHHGDERVLVNLIRLNQLKELGLIPAPNETELHLTIISNQAMDDFQISAANLWFRKLISANAKTKVYNKQKFNEMLAVLWMGVFAKKVKFKTIDIIRIMRSPLRKYLKVNFKQKIDLAIKCFKKLFKEEMR